ncbi:MAG: hypothetical protein ACJ76F_09515 [Bacteroidia bacterium]
MNLFNKALSTDTGINYTNIGLMLLSTLLAFIIPFQLFLFVYAVLGPLHYLTEISWLDKRSYFVKRKFDVWLLVIPALVLTYGLLNPKSKTNTINTALIATALIYAFVLVFIEKPVIRYALFFIVFIVVQGLKIDASTNLFVAFGIMLPTLIHVYLFTGIFILAGALKTRSSSAILSIVVFILCTFSFFFFNNIGSLAELDATTRSNMQYFTIINKALIYIFDIQGLNTDADLFTHPAALALERFIAFAYTYHYLNWFSKTTVIKWHEVSRNRMIIIALLWIVAVAAYFINYKLGFDVLFLLSMLHVFFEFPLNIQTIKGLGTFRKK